MFFLTDPAPTRVTICLHATHSFCRNTFGTSLTCDYLNYLHAGRRNLGAAISYSVSLRRNLHSGAGQKQRVSSYTVDTALGIFGVVHRSIGGSEVPDEFNRHPIVLGRLHWHTIQLYCPGFGRDFYNDTSACRP
jgi:hypothetical protein